jgi:MFS family permease
MIARNSTMRNANFGLYYVGQATSETGNGLVPVVFAFAALQVTPSGGLIPLVLLALWLSRMVLLPIGATVSERGTKATVMLFADVGRLLAQLIVAIPFAFGHGAAWQLIVSAGLYGACTAFFVPASFALLPKMVDKSYLQRANALLGIAHNFGLVVGPAFGGLLVTWGGVALALFFDVGTFLASVATLAVLRLRFTGEATAPREPESGLPIRFRDSLRIIPQVPGIAAVLAVCCTVQLGTAAVAVLGPVVAIQSLGGIGAWSAIVTAMAAAALIGSAIATKLHVRNIVRWTLVAFSAFTPIELLAIAVPFSVWMILGVIVCTTVVTEIAGVIFSAYVQRSVPEEYLARVGALESGLLGVMNPIGIAIAFPMASLFGIKGFLIGAGVIVLLTALAAGGSMHAFGVRRTDLMSVHTSNSTAGESATEAETRDVAQA